MMTSGEIIWKARRPIIIRLRLRKRNRDKRISRRRGEEHRAEGAGDRELQAVPEVERKERVMEDADEILRSSDLPG